MCVVSPIAYCLFTIAYLRLPIIFSQLPKLDSFLSFGGLYCWYTKTNVFAYGEEHTNMNRYSLRLAWVGMLIGVLTLSAAAIARLVGDAPRPVRADPVSSETATTTAFADEAADAWDEPAAEVFAPAQAACDCVLCFAAAPAPAYELRDLRGNSCGVIVPGKNREAALGQLQPGRYLIACGDDSVGSFRVTETAELTEATGRLWTDGNRLWLEDFSPGAAEIRLALPHPGYYSFQLVDDLGRKWTRDVFIPDSAHQDRDGTWSRTLLYDGLPEGRYTLVLAGQPLTQFQVLAGGTAMIDAAGSS